ncbi:aldehyde dehydrogenase family protein [Tsuneonella mangrovi]|uniref:aldehyde dehydrogenase family protein n=1 Tax=Tsuneonella mangrovi TaxID=1982042 RepID=UPI000BA2ADA0|nr:aldehyde dehydrogenase family protein [Tsuneonella mangrovi]
MNSPAFFRAYIDGRWVDGSSGRRIAVHNPASDAVWAEVPDCGVEECEEALAACDRAGGGWRALTPMQRAKYLEALNRKLEDEMEHFARLIVMEQGKTYKEALGEVADTIGYMKYAAHSARWLRGDILPADNPNERLMTFKVPYGVCVALCAYNYPLALIGRKVGPALVTGNTVVIKPHEATPVTASEFCRLVDEVGLPKGVVSLVTGYGANVGAGLVSNRRTRLVTLTGSIAAGQRVAKLASENLASLVLELGGKAPFIVMADANVDAAVEAATVARFANSGQVCICNEMAFIDRRIVAEFTDKLLKRVAAITLGDPMDNPGMGPISTAGARDRIAAMVNEVRVHGAQVLIGGEAARPEGLENGYWYKPTVISGSSASMPLIRDEIFGPVLPILPIEDFDEAVHIVNERDDGLSAYLWTNDNGTINRAIDELETGTVFVNKGISGSFHGYHNGHKRSGLGGEDGPYGLENYLQKRSVYLAYGQ